MSETNPVVRVVSIVGFQNSGKTTLVQEMTSIFSKAGLCVGVLKHDGHADAGVNDWEKPDSDTRKASSAGAIYTMVTGGGESLLRTVRDPRHANPIALIERLLLLARNDNQPLDVVIIEGFKRFPLPKFVVLGEVDQISSSDFAEWPNTVGVVCSSRVNVLDDTKWQVYDEADVDKLCQHVLNHPIFVFDRTFEQ